MFYPFFQICKAKGLSITMSEWLALQDALEQGMAGSSLTQFYYLARMILVKSETEFDKFDMAFEECFKGVKSENEVTAQMLRWLDKSDMMELAHEEARAHLNQMEDNTVIDKEDVEQTFKDRLRDQNEEHNGGSFWIGTMGKTSFGNMGGNVGGVRILSGYLLSITLSISPYSRASWAVRKLSRSVSRSTTSMGWPVRSESISFSRFLVRRMWLAWMLISVA